MEKLVITGGKPLYGHITVSGAKNSVIAIIPAAILVNDIVCIENVPDIEDVHVIIDILKSLNVKVKVENRHKLIIDSTRINSYEASYEMVKKMRASYYLLGALVGRFKKAKVALPGGCDFGVRPIDQHIKGFEALGCETRISHGIVHLNAKNLHGSQIYMDVVSVGATINLMLAAVLADGITFIENAAKEPHIVDVANFLNAMGAEVRGAGTDVIKIKGVEKLHGGTYSVIPDQIEAGTYMIAAAAAGGDVIIDNVIPKHLESVSAKLIEMNVDVIEMDDSIRVRREGPLKKANVKTLPYPGFPTDLQPPIVALLSIAEGTSMVTEGVWDSRFRYVDELKRMGANIKVDGKVAVVEGVESLSGAPVRSTDLRAGAAMVVAALTAQGVTEIHDLRHIDRGYERIEKKLAGVGAQIKRIRIPDLQDAVV
jgi:UDP-N-acetylglucosamine 1-carboxyvinyltransferase